MKTNVQERIFTRPMSRFDQAAPITRLSATNANISRIFLTGGGAHFYEDALRKRLPGYEIISMSISVMSNARGYWLAGAEKFMNA
ncbi:MAG: hypothetical protein U1C47_03185 [Hydrogenophaga sp.]|nr:hypothetical protein [Hydrogenophaga sp.]